jgi:hypothetical protein
MGFGAKPQWQEKKSLKLDIFTKKQVYLNIAVSNQASR